MAQRGRPPKNIFTEEKNLKIDNSPRVNTEDVEIEIKTAFPYSPNGYDIVTLQPGRYKASELHLVVIELHKRGVV